MVSFWRCALAEWFKAILWKKIYFEYYIGSNPIRAPQRRRHLQHDWTANGSRALHKFTSANSLRTIYTQGTRRNRLPSHLFFLSHTMYPSMFFPPSIPWLGAQCEGKEDGSSLAEIVESDASFLWRLIVYEQKPTSRLRAMLH